jgi:Protein of unknown function (DUF3710)
VFRRRRKDPNETARSAPDSAFDDGDELGEDSSDDAGAAGADRPDSTAVPVLDRSAGPFDESETPDDGLLRLDLGGLLVPGLEGMELRLDVDETGETVVACNVVHGDSAVQLMAFAAPRTTGIWDDVREEIRGSLASQGPVEVAKGIFGQELLATLPVAGPQGQSGMQPVRFVGIDGPRWFLRGLFSGAAARSAAAAEPLEAVLRATVVVRGTDPMAPGDPLPLHVPTGVPEGLEAGEPAPGRTTLPPPERGPEITEIR